MCKLLIYFLMGKIDRLNWLNFIIKIIIWIENRINCTGLQSYVILIFSF